jgi:hypothetical protein
VDADNDAASFPAVSWTALFEVALFEEGGLYATVTVEDPEIEVDIVSCTVEPLTRREATVAGELSTVTEKSVVAAVVEFKSSVYVSVKTRPVASRLADTNVGGVTSYVDPFETGVAAKEIASFPSVSWIALLDTEVLEDGALYTTVTTSPF